MIYLIILSERADSGKDFLPKFLINVKFPIAAHDAIRICQICLAGLEINQNLFQHARTVYPIEGLWLLPSKLIH